MPRSALSTLETLSHFLPQQVSEAGVTIVISSELAEAQRSSITLAESQN